MSVDPIDGIEITRSALRETNERDRSARLHLLGFVFSAIAEGRSAEELVMTLDLHEQKQGLFGPRDMTPEDRIVEWIYHQARQLLKDRS